MKIGILWAGEFGRALGVVARKNGHVTYFYDPFIYPERTLRDIVEFSDMLVLATPSKAVCEIFSLFPAEAFYKPLVVATKGVLNFNLYPKFEEFEILSGPGFAKDLEDGRKIKLTVAKERILESGRTFSEKAFGSKTLSFDKTDDVAGVMMLGALKNIFAIESGRRGLVVKTEEFKEFMVTALGEAQKFLIYNGGFLETIRLSAGIGDFVLTCGSDRSRNYRFGRRLRGARKTGKIRSLDGILRGEKVISGGFSGKNGGILAKNGGFLIKNNWFLTKSRKNQKIETIEGVSAVEEIETEGLFVPRELEILPDIMRRIKNATKYETTRSCRLSRGTVACSRGAWNRKNTSSFGES